MSIVRLAEDAVAEGTSSAAWILGSLAVVMVLAGVGILLMLRRRNR